MATSNTSEPRPPFSSNLMVFERFEIVNAPVEHRLVDGITNQANFVIDALAQHISGLKEAATDKEAIARVSKASVALCMPGTIPNFLFIAACVLKLLYAILLRVRSRKLLDRASESLKRVE